ncbi:MAG TPA: polysaccharide deacetylase family protein [Gemmatimonadales bacterium]
MTLVVSIHDVTPAHAPDIAQLWHLCTARRVVPALLVVPNWHGCWPLHEHPEFVTWLLARAGEGAEIVLHGERHDEVGLRRGLRDALRAFGRTAAEGEFLTLDETGAKERIERGLKVLRDLGLQPIGFVPPAWLAREGCQRAVRSSGLRFTEDEHAVQLFPSGRRLRSPVVRWSGRSSPRAMASVAVAAGRWRLQRRAALVRVALHPQDLQHPATARSVVRSLDRWLSLRRTMSYGVLSASAGSHLMRP